MKNKKQTNKQQQTAEQQRYRLNRSWPMKPSFEGASRMQKWRRKQISREQWRKKLNRKRS